MDFDPLAFFTPEIPVADEEVHVTAEDGHPQVERIMDSGDAAADQEEDVGLIHVLDFPSLTKSLPREVLLTIFNLLKPQQETNFGPGIVQDDEMTPEEILHSKAVDKRDYDRTFQWLNNNGYTRLSTGLLHLTFNQDFFQYLNKILSSSCFGTDEEIIQLASLRISENCGRTARPNFQRRILLNGFDTPIMLNEPALTADSLGLKTWGSSLVLSELVVQEHERLILDPVLELGAGTGLVGITTGMLGYDTTLTDLPEILPNLQNNTELNGLAEKVKCLVLDWTDPSSFVDQKGDMKYNTIVVADPIYSQDHPRWVVNMMIKFLVKSRDARVLLQIPMRKLFEQERATLWKILEDEKFDIVDDRLIDGYDDFGAQKFIYKELRWSEQVLMV